MTIGLLPEWDTKKDMSEAQKLADEAKKKAEKEAEAAKKKAGTK